MNKFKREIKAASAPRERIELDGEIMPNENMDHSFHLSHKSLEIVKDLYAKRPQGDKLFEFSYRYVYDNNEKSVWSSKSIVPLPQQPTIELTDVNSSSIMYADFFVSDDWVFSINSTFCKFS